MKQLIIGISGYKGSGKSTLARDLMCRRLELNLEKSDEVGLFAFMDEGKRVCVKLLGLAPQCVYGTDEDKNRLTKIRWEDMPHYLEIRKKVEADAWKEVEIADGKLSVFQKLNRWCFLGGKVGDWKDVVCRKMQKYSGFMTHREVMQEVGSGVLRRMNPDCHIHATISNIKESDCGLALIADVRFPNEVEAIKKAGGVVIRLTRNVAGTDTHESETKLNPDVFDWRKFDIVLDNSNIDVGAQCHQAMLGLASLGLVRDIHVGRPFDGSKVLTVNQ